MLTKVDQRHQDEYFLCKKVWKRSTKDMRLSTAGAKLPMQEHGARIEQAKAAGLPCWVIVSWDTVPIKSTDLYSVENSRSYERFSRSSRFSMSQKHPACWAQRVPSISRKIYLTAGAADSVRAIASASSKGG